MKTTILFTFIFMIALSFTFSQNCEAYIPTDAGKTLMYKTTDKKGKVQSYYSHELLSTKNQEDRTLFEIRNISYNDKKEMIREDTLEFICKDNVFYLDMSGYLNKEQLSPYEETEIEINFDNIGYPADLKPGSILNDGYVEANVNAGVIIKFRTDIQNRKVESFEDITTEAGEFKTLKISEDIISKLGFVTLKMNSVSWITLNIGTIRSESYDKKANLISTTELISIE